MKSDNLLEALHSGEPAYFSLPKFDFSVGCDRLSQLMLRPSSYRWYFGLCNVEMPTLPELANEDAGFGKSRGPESATRRAHRPRNDMELLPAPNKI